MKSVIICCLAPVLLNQSCGYLFLKMGTHFLGVYRRDKMSSDKTFPNEVFYPDSNIRCFQTVCIYDFNGQMSVTYCFKVPLL